MSIRHALRPGAGVVLDRSIHARFLPGDAARSYFTNADRMKKSDPYAALGLTWGATVTDIKEAYRRRARELHPDTSRLEPSAALRQFRVVQEAYDALVNHKHAGAPSADSWENWSFGVWRSGDAIAQARTDVAGQMRKRPARPAASETRRWGVASLGHPDGRGLSARGEYLADGGKKRPTQRSSTVGTGRSKWVKKKEFRPWKAKEDALKGASRCGKHGDVGRKLPKAMEGPVS